MSRGLAYAIAIIVVLFRCFVFVYWEQARFDSDEAITGLMAKHLSEFRALPVFFYGQQYMLGVEAWLAAPVFWLFGPSVAALKVPLVLVNLAAAMLLLWILMSQVTLRPVFALVASLFFLLPPPGTAAELVRANGGSIEPFLYVLLIWLTRDRPILLGSVLGIGVLNREFTIYGFAALLTVEALNRTLFKSAAALKYAVAVAMMIFVFEGVSLAKQFSSAAGPDTSLAQIGTPSHLNELRNRLCLDVTKIPAGVAALVTDHWAWLFGLEQRAVTFSMVNATSIQGMWGSWVVMVALVALAATRLITNGGKARQRPWTGLPAFPFYLMLTGLGSALVYALGRCGAISIGTMRYDLLSLFAPVGLLGAFLAVERNRRVEIAAIALVLGWTAVSVLGHVRVIEEFATRTPRNLGREVATELDKRGIRFGEADYWLAYRVTFLANEHIILASTSVPRILMYERLVDAHSEEAVRLQQEPCPRGELLVQEVYLCRSR